MKRGPEFMLWRNLQNENANHYLSLLKRIKLFNFSQRQNFAFMLTLAFSTT